MVEISNLMGLQAGQEEEPESDSYEEMELELEAQHATEALSIPEFLREFYLSQDNYNSPFVPFREDEEKRQEEAGKPYIAQEIKDITHILIEKSEEGESARISLPSLETAVQKWRQFDGNDRCINYRMINSAEFFILIGGNLVPTYERQKAIWNYICAETRCREHDFYPGEKTG